MNFDQEKNDFWKRYSEKSPSALMEWNSFEKIGTVGHGAYSQVFLLKTKSTNKLVVCKEVLKRKMIDKNQLKQIYHEKNILRAVNCPFIINSLFTTKDNDAVYIFMPFMSGGDLLSLLCQFRKLSEPCSRFLTAQTLLAIEYLHEMNIIHRDIKPENILVDKTGYIKLADLGMSKELTKRAYSFCGTPEYIAPEIIRSKLYGKSADWWSFGVLIYELTEGKTPFYRDRDDDIILYGKISKAEFSIPNTFSAELQDLIQQILQVNISKRLGCITGQSSSEEIKLHKWYQDTNWTQLSKQEAFAPIKPQEIKENDLKKSQKYKEKKYTRSPICLYEKEFSDF